MATLRVLVLERRQRVRLEREIFIVLERSSVDLISIISECIELGTNCNVEDYLSAYI